MGYSTRTFLITPGDNIRKIGSAHHWDMLRDPDSHRLPEFARQRVQLATLTIRLVDRKPVYVIDRHFEIVTFDAQGRLDVDQMMHRASAMFELAAINGGRSTEGGPAKVVDATARFTVQGGRWKPSPALIQALDEVALGLRRCPML